MDSAHPIQLPSRRCRTVEMQKLDFTFANGRREAEAFGLTKGQGTLLPSTMIEAFRSAIVPLAQASRCLRA